MMYLEESCLLRSDNLRNDLYNKRIMRIACFLKKVS